ncbi:MAG: hypothetical protein ACFCVF_16485 [Kineosporiaceae bacterium]
MSAGLAGPAGPVSGYPYDEDVLADLARRLLAAMPAMYRVPDEPPAGRGDLARLLRVLAAPLAVVRQNIAELHADLFIDTASDEMIPRLAELVGATLVFPDAGSNRRDVRGTVGWRRRKGTPAALEEMGTDLLGRPVVLQEGWRRVLLTQDLDILRPERTLVDTRPAVVAEQASGPLDAVSHLVELRGVTATTGAAHPRTVAHWVFPTQTFPLRSGTAHLRPSPGEDMRYSVDPLGVRRPLRVRRPPGDTGPFLDRIPERHFAADPARWWGRDGGVRVDVCGLPAAVAAVGETTRAPSRRPAARTLARGPGAAVSVTDLPGRGWHGPVRVELGLAPVTGAGGAQWSASLGAFAVTGSVDLDGGQVTGTASGAAPDPGGARVPVLRLVAEGSGGRFFPGAVLTLTGAGPGTTSATSDPALAAEGFLTGALHVRVPPVEVRGQRWLLVAADGSLYEAADEGGTAQPMPRDDTGLLLAEDALLGVGPGPVWPPAAPAAEPDMIERVPGAPGRGPAVLHGLEVLRRNGSRYAPLPGSAACALSFAVQVERPGGAWFRPFQRLEWTGTDPSTATWTVLGEDGLPVAPAGWAGELAAVARLRDDNAGLVSLAVRFESDDAAASACPGEVAWSGDDGTGVLVHLPQLDVEPATESPWPPDPAYPHAGDVLRVGVDGSTWESGALAGRRMSLGPAAPVRESAAMTRRRVRGRRLCAWDAEDPAATPPLLLDPTPPGLLDLDVAHGLFSVAAAQAPQRWPDPAAGGPPPPESVTVAHEVGATAHAGALPAAREPLLDRRLPRPTRLVAGAGALHRDAPPDWHDIPRYRTLADALDAVDTAWSALTAADAGEHVEVVQFEDSATYPGESPRWPAGPADPAAAEACLLTLVVQAAEREQPVVLVDPVAGWRPPAGPARYESVSLCGIAFGGPDWPGVTVPPARSVDLRMCTVIDAANEIAITAADEGSAVLVWRCLSAGVRLDGPGALVVEDGVVDAGAVDADAVSAPAGRVALERVSVLGRVQARVLEISESILDGDAVAEDRFRGCARYSRVTSTSQLPRAHRLAVDTPLRLVSRNRRDPAWWRLRADCDPAVAAGAENGGELGAYAAEQLTARLAGHRRRLAEFTPAGLRTGVIRID